MKEKYSASIEYMLRIFFKARAPHVGQEPISWSVQQPLIIATAFFTDKSTFLVWIYLTLHEIKINRSPNKIRA